VPQGHGVARRQGDRRLRSAARVVVVARAHDDRRRPSASAAPRCPGRCRRVGRARSHARRGRSVRHVAVAHQSDGARRRDRRNCRRVRATDRRSSWPRSRASGRCHRPTA
jgi:hypothetical protein